MATGSLRIAAPLLLSLATSLTTAACIGMDEPVSDVEIPLSYRAPDGESYRLRGVQLLVGGRIDEVVVPADADATVALAVPEGHYTVTLAPGWTLERATAGESFAPVSAQLVVDPRPFAVLPDRDYLVGLRFRIDEGAGDATEVTFRRGPTMQIAGSLQIDEAEGALSRYHDGNDDRPLTYRLSFEPDIRDSFSEATGRWQRAYRADDVRVRFDDDRDGLLRGADLSDGLLDYQLRLADGGVIAAGSFRSPGLTIDFEDGNMTDELAPDALPVDGIAGAQPFAITYRDSDDQEGSLRGGASIELITR
jgi:hypothetical protein